MPRSSDERMKKEDRTSAFILADQADEIRQRVIDWNRHEMTKPREKRKRHFFFKELDRIVRRGLKVTRRRRRLQISSPISGSPNKIAS